MTFNFFFPLLPNQITVIALKSSHEPASVYIYLTVNKLLLICVLSLELTCLITAKYLRGSARVHICRSVYILTNVGQGRILRSAAAKQGISNLTFDSPKGKREEKKLTRRSKSRYCWMHIAQERTRGRKEG